MRLIALQALLLICFSTNLFSQGFLIQNDTLFSGGEEFGLINRNGNAVKVTYVSAGLKNKYFAGVRRQLQQNCSSCIVSNDIDKYLFFPPLSISESRISYNGKPIGTTSLELFSKGYLVRIVIITRSVTPEEYEYIEDEVRAQMKAQLKKRVITELSVDYSGEDYRIEREMARIEAERARERERIEREEAVENEKRISRFYEVVFSRFSGKLLPVEGIYRSIFKGDNQAYDLVILKRIDRFREYKAYVFESRKGDLKVGYPVFTLESTAQSNSFLVDYSTRGGFDIDDKLAILDQGMINLGERSFIKIFPIEGQSERDSKLRPKVDFDRSGSGVIVSSTGLVLTNHHVIDQAKSIIIQLRDSSGNKLESEARVLREQRENDIAVLQILNASLIPSEQIYPELITDVRLGQEVYTMGYPISTKMGENMKVVDGIISSLTGAQDDQKYIQTTLPVWYGNSGGPCFNDRGQLIGLVTSVMYHQGEKAEGVAYVTKAQGILDLLEGLEFDQNDPNSSEIPLEVLIEKYSPLSVFIKVKF